MPANAIWWIGAALALLAWRVIVLERRTADLRRRLRALEQPLEPVAMARKAPAQRRDWEALVGTNWLSRLGAVVLVIGIALFLGYTLTQLGPFGKIGIGFAVGISLLTAGVLIGRRDLYRTWSWSLVGAGWAVIYFTTFAMYGLPASRVIASPAAGTAALIAVSAAMIAHAVSWHSETAAGLAWLMAFAGLHFAPLDAFAALAITLLVVSLAALSYRFRWLRLPLIASVAAYLGFAFRHDSAPTGQTVLWLYWLSFEALDLLSPRRRVLLTLNFCGFVGASVLNGAGRWHFFAAAAAAYLLSAFVRSRSEQAAAAEPAGGPAEYEIAAAASAILAAAALVDRFSGAGITVALLLEGELTLLAGIAVRSAWIARLGAVLLALPVFRLLAIDVGSPGWAALAVATAAVLAANRAFLVREWYFAAGAATVASALAVSELPRLWSAPAIAAAAAGLLLTRRTDLVWISVPALVFAFARAIVVNIGEGDVWTTAVVVLGLYAGQRLWPAETSAVRTALGLLGTALLTRLVYGKVYGRLLTVSLGFEGGVLLAAGFLLRDRTLRLSGLALFLLCIAKLFLHDLRQLDAVSRILSFIVLGVMLMAASWLYTRFRDKFSRLL